MANKCSICDKGVISGNKISHSTRHTKRTWSPNLKKVRAIVNGAPKRISVCTSCLRSGKVKRAI